MTTNFHLCDNHDDPCDPDAWSFVSTPVPGSFRTIELALQAAVARAVQLATDGIDDVFSVDIVMTLQDGGAGMTLLSVHVWWDHPPDMTWLRALATDLPVARPPHVVETAGKPRLPR